MKEADRIRADTRVFMVDLQIKVGVAVWIKTIYL
jgi:hypothetical protein